MQSTQSLQPTQATQRRQRKQHKHSTDMVTREENSVPALIVTALLKAVTALAATAALPEPAQSRLCPVAPEWLM